MAVFGLVSRQLALTLCLLRGFHVAVMQEFLPILPAGLGFAAGAMLWVAIFELLTDALEHTSRTVAYGTCLASACAMAYTQQIMRQ